MERKIDNYERPEELIVRKALELGYESCGIIGIDELDDFTDRMDERLKKAPGNDDFYGEFSRFKRLREDYPWAKSIVVCIVKYGYYRLPAHLVGSIAKHYLTDVRSNENCKEYIASFDFEEFLHSLGLKTATNRRLGIAPMRMSAQKAGLGIIRRNNFFYTDSGSSVHIEGFLTDREMELKQSFKHEPCPDNCDLCISACPTKSLSEPYTMSPASCVSPLTTRESDLINSPYSAQMGQWIYGCDMCQDACPYNAGKWRQNEDFPGLEELGNAITPESIVSMDDERLAELLASKFLYISKERIYQWKLNALNAMRNAARNTPRNDYDDKYEGAVRAALDDPNEQVRNMAAWVLEQVFHAGG